MWYLVMKFQDILLTLPFLAYWRVRRIPFHSRCKFCNKLLLERQYVDNGVCEKCERKMVSADTYYAYMATQFPDRKLERMTFPTNTGFDGIYRRVTQRVRPGAVLDVGCGQGFIFSGLGSHTGNLCGIDIQSAAIKAAKNWVGGADFCFANAQNIPFKDGSFDSLICTEVLEHVDNDNVLKECHRVLKPGGTALITVPNGAGPSGMSNPTHIRLFGFKKWSRLLRSAGFEIVHSEKHGLYIPFYSPFCHSLIRISRGRVKLPPYIDIIVPEFFADGFLFECRKGAPNS